MKTNRGKESNVMGNHGINQSPGGALSRRDALKLTAITLTGSGLSYINPLTAMESQFYHDSIIADDKRGKKEWNY